MQSKATTVKQYLDGLEPDRREALEAIRRVILDNLDEDYEEGMQYGMIGYFVPHSVYPNGYHCDPRQPLPFASIASQKNHIGIYLFCIYCDPNSVEWFQEQWAMEREKGNAGRLDMGKSCVRVKKLEDVPLGLIGKTIKRMPAKKFIRFYESSFGADRPRPASKKTGKKSASKKAGAKTTGKKASTKKPAARKPTRKKRSKRSSA